MKLYETYRIWRKEGFQECDGVVVGCDQSQEWILPWWWENYQRHNSHPVAFVDLGMSLSAKEWCKSKGTYIHLPIADIFVAEKSEIDPTLVQQWESTFVNFWEPRNAWFKKPSACLQSPYRRSVWIDLDCEIKSSIEPLFAFADHPSGLALGRIEKRGYNSGVVAFRRNLDLIERWAELAFTKNHQAVSDEDILNEAIVGRTIGELPSIYNWSRCWEENRDTVILHWHGNKGKQVIAYQIHSRQIGL
ncbi:MAG: hypothetical protein JSS32_00930 [Verrucomicrobia bacterium]|nr:hypothetical protein [Verrucomicrobiota bacterium]